jgi:hypothetical protein
MFSEESTRKTYKNDPSLSREEKKRRESQSLGRKRQKLRELEADGVLFMQDDDENAVPSRLFTPQPFYLFTVSGIFSPSGRCLADSSEKENSTTDFPSSATRVDPLPLHPTVSDQTSPCLGKRKRAVDDGLASNLLSVYPGYGRVLIPASSPDAPPAPFVPPNSSDTEEDTQGNSL